MSVAEESTEPKGESDNQNPGDRFEIAIKVLQWSTIGLFVITAVLLIGAASAAFKGQGDPKIFMEAARLAFTSVLPLLGSWVGTVLAYYFSRQNFESANRSVASLTKQLTGDDRLKAIPVKDKMIPFDKMDVQRPKSTLEAMTLKDDIKAFMNDKKRKRLPILDAEGKALLVVHLSVVEGLLLDKSLDGASPEDVAKLTIKDLFEDPQYQGLKTNSFAAVGESATLAEAKAAMENRDGCRDVLVTENGNRNGKVVGWLTNIVITEASRAWG